MITSHKLGIIAAVLIGLLLLVGIVFGNGVALPANINASQDVRTVCLAAWAVLIPGWWTLEEQMWLPEPGPARDQFRKGQAAARTFWLLAGFAVFAITGLTPPKTLH